MRYTLSTRRTKVEKMRLTPITFPEITLPHSAAEAAVPVGLSIAVKIACVNVEIKYEVAPNKHEQAKIWTGGFVF